MLLAGTLSEEVLLEIDNVYGIYLQTDEHL